jgi:RNA polymerase sigma-70 factor (ECF subfamily)
MLLRDPSLAEDAFQELFAMLLHRGEAFRQAEAPYRWLCRAAERTSLDLLRRRKRVRDAIPIDDADLLGAAPGTDAEARRAVLESIERLDPEQQRVAILLFVDGMSQLEAAAELGVSRVTINKRAQEIRSAVSLRLELDAGTATTEASP